MISEEKIQIAINRIAEMKGIPLISHSGGKDSDAIQLLCEMMASDDERYKNLHKKARYIHTPKPIKVEGDGNRTSIFQETLNHLYKVVIPRSTRPFIFINSDEMLLYASKGKKYYLMDGTRRDEASREDKSDHFIHHGVEINRSEMDRSSYFPGLFGMQLCYPIYDWSDDDVFSFLESNWWAISKEYAHDEDFIAWENSRVKTHLNDAITGVKEIEDDKHYTIIAPHVDDEMIGCWSLLKSKKVRSVVYRYDLNEERSKEAYEASKAFGFSVIISQDDESFSSSIRNAIQNDDVIVVPSKHDLHPHHREARAKTLELLREHRHHKVMSYSIDMNHKPQLVTDFATKKDALLKYYPSQSTLINSDDKYSLFEQIEEDVISVSESSIWVTFQKKGIHLFDRARVDEELKDVEYLGYPHRHLFKFRVSISVTHDDREIEFHQFLNWLEGLYDGNVLDLDGRSCEMIGKELLVRIQEKYKNRNVIIEVSEDGENGSVIKSDMRN